MAILATVTTQSTRPLDNPQWESFAQAIARGETTSQAAVSAGYSTHTAGTQGRRLKSDERIATRILAIKTEIVAQLQRSVAPPVLQATQFVRQQVQERAYRLSIVQDVVDRLRSLMDARAAAFVESGEVCPGGETGLLARSIKMIGSGANAVQVTEYRLDGAVLSELRESLKQAAIESGDWEEKQIKASAPADDETRGMSVEELYARQAILLEAKAKIDALKSGKSVEAHRVIEARPEASIEVVGVACDAVANTDNGLQDRPVSDDMTPGTKDVGDAL